MLVVDVGVIIGGTDELNTCFFTFNPAKSAGHRNIFAGDLDTEPLGQVPEGNRRKLRAGDTHILQFAEHTTSFVANQQADRVADFVARVNVSSVVHTELI